MIAIPAWITDLASFCQWACSDEYPERGCISYFKGYLWVDLSFENIAHNRAKVVIIAKLDRLTKDAGSVHLGGMRLTHPEADFSTEPDGMYISYEAIKNRRIEFPNGDESLEAVGTPDMILEVVSDDSEKKDTKELLELYWKAGIQEYWIVDVRNGKCQFDIYRRGGKGFTALRKQGGWVKSNVFGKQFRLSRKESASGLSDYKLEAQ